MGERERGDGVGRHGGRGAGGGGSGAWDVGSDQAAPSPRTVLRAAAEAAGGGAAAAAASGSGPSPGGRSPGMGGSTPSPAAHHLLHRGGLGGGRGGGAAPGASPPTPPLPASTQARSTAWSTGGVTSCGSSPDAGAAGGARPAGGGGGGTRPTAQPAVGATSGQWGVAPQGKPPQDASAAAGGAGGPAATAVSPGAPGLHKRSTLSQHGGGSSPGARARPGAGHLAQGREGQEEEGQQEEDKDKDEERKHLLGDQRRSSGSAGGGLAQLGFWVQMGVLLSSAEVWTLLCQCLACGLGTGLIGGRLLRGSASGDRPGQGTMQASGWASSSVECAAGLAMQMGSWEEGV